MGPVPGARTGIRGRLLGSIKRACRLIATCLACCRQGYAAAALYDGLARLSKAELEHRGMTREDIYRHIRNELDKDTSDGKWG
jgi:hypothetical protein